MARLEHQIGSNKDRIQDDLHRIQSMLASHVAQSAEIKNAISKNSKNQKNEEIEIKNLEIDDRIHQVVEEHIERYAADKTGMADFALESAGGEVIICKFFPKVFRVNFSPIDLNLNVGQK